MMAAAVLLPAAGLVWGIIYACSPETPRRQWGGYAIAASSICIVLGFIITMAVVGAAGDATLESTPDISERVTEPPAPSGVPVTSRPDPASQVQMLDWTFETDIVNVDPLIYNEIIQGDAVNNSDRTLSYAQVEFNLYDSSDRQIGVALANVSNWEPGSTWHFEALVMEESATRARFKGFTVW